MRADRIRLPLTELARRAGVAPSTAYRGVNGKDPRTSTLRRLAEELEHEERTLLAHLRELERSRGGRQLDLVDALRKGNAA